MLLPSLAAALPVRLVAAEVKLKPERASREEKRLRSVVELQGGGGAVGQGNVAVVQCCSAPVMQSRSRPS